jgi:hypothetical protein
MEQACCIVAGTRRDCGFVIGCGLNSNLVVCRWHAGRSGLESHIYERRRCFSKLATSVFHVQSSCDQVEYCRSLDAAILPRALAVRHPSLPFNRLGILLGPESDDGSPVCARIAGSHRRGEWLVGERVHPRRVSILSLGAFQTTCCHPTMGATLASITYFATGTLVALSFDLAYFLAFEGDWASTSISIFVFTFVIVYLKFPPLLTKVTCPPLLSSPLVLSQLPFADGNRRERDRAPCSVDSCRSQ